jgi:ABC-type nitrate/sulfonate/bicarbonate transport system permease component
MLVNMVRGLSSADEETLELVHSLKASRWQELRMVRLPSSLPYLFVALKLGAASALVAAIAAEYLGSLEGLGHLLILSKMELDTALMWAVVLVATIIGMLAYGAVALIERRTLRWQPEEEAGRV